MSSTPYTLRQLEYFVAVAATGSISAAAQSMFVSESAVASALGELEKCLRVQLCVRQKSRGVTLTSSGHQLLPQARRLLEVAADLQENMTGQGLELSGNVTVGMSAALAPTFLPPLMQTVCETYPGIAFRYKIANHGDLLSMLTTGQADLGLFAGTDLGPDFVTRNLYDQDIFALLSAGHPLADRESVRLEELAREPMILLDTVPAEAHATELFATAGVTPRIAHRTDSIELVRSMVGRGLGYSLQMLSIEGKRSHEGRPLVELPIADSVAKSRHIFLAWPRGILLSPRADAVIHVAQLTAPEPHAKVGHNDSIEQTAGVH